MKNKINFLISVALLISLIFNSCKKENTSNKYTDLDEEILSIINLHRNSLNLAELITDEIIWELANIHSKNMADSTVQFFHDGFNERIEIINTAIAGSGNVAENIAYGAVSAQDVVDMWLNNDGHRDNIEGDYNLTGVSAVQSEDGLWYFTQIFCKGNEK